VGLLMLHHPLRFMVGMTLLHVDSLLRQNPRPKNFLRRLQVNRGLLAGLVALLAALDRLPVIRLQVAGHARSDDLIDNRAGLCSSILHGPSDHRRVAAVISVDREGWERRTCSFISGELILGEPERMDWLPPAEARALRHEARSRLQATLRRVERVLEDNQQSRPVGV
jgi:hypothetical protein